MILADNALMIDTPLPDLDAWVAFFSQADIPVLRHTEHQLADLRANANKSNARVISSVILHDPMMTLRVLAYIELKRNKSRNTEITTIERALMMIGMEPFFRDFQSLPLIEDQLKPHPRALLGLLKVIKRARKATHWARDWAIYRHDLDVNEIMVATLLYDAAEILMWCFAPQLALRVTEMQKADRTLRSVAVQNAVFNVPLYQLKQALAQTWHLPELLTTLMNQDNADHPRVKNVKLAIDLARHSANGWDDAALPDDFTAIGEFLHLSPEALMRRLGLDKPFATPETAAMDNQPQ
jgi:HD-like signal output (HDOD) protein